jgi:hypothetical protein
MPGTKITNEYAQTLGDLYDKVPKAVLAAVVVSLMSCGGDNLEDDMPRQLLDEWQCLHECGIVPQRPPVQRR